MAADDAQPQDETPMMRHRLEQAAFGGIVLLALLTIVAFVGVQYVFAQEATTPDSSLPPLALSDIRGVNYVRTTADDPDICPDLHYGQDNNCPWNMEAINADLDRLQAHGVNTVRIFLNYYAFGGARLTNPDYTMDAALVHLDEFIDAANERGIYVMPILLSKYPQDYGFDPDHYEVALDLHVRPVVRHLAQRDGIIAWDLFNEIDIGSPIDVRCWDWANEDFPLCHPMANRRIHFLRVVSEEVRRLDTRQRPITASMAFSKNYFQPEGTDYYMADLVDFFAFHYYDNEPYDSGRYEAHWYYGEGFPADLDRAMQELRDYDPEKPIVLTEIGFPTGPDMGRTTADLHRDLHTAYQLVHEEHDSGVMLWPFQPEPEELLADLYR